MGGVKRIVSMKVDEQTRMLLNHNFNWLLNRFFPLEEPLKIGTAGGYAQFDTDGTLGFFEAATIWDDMRFPATQLRVSPVSLKPDFDEANVGFLFDPGSTETLLVIAQMPHGWKIGSTIYPHVHWMPTSTGTGNVLWRLEYKWVNIGATEPASFTTISALAAADGVVGKHQISMLPAMPGTGLGLSSIISMKLSRIGGDVTDTYAADALLKEFDIHYEIDSVGSRETMVK